MHAASASACIPVQPRAAAVQASSSSCQLSRRLTASGVDTAKDDVPAVTTDLELQEAVRGPGRCAAIGAYDGERVALASGRDPKANDSITFCTRYFAALMGKCMPTCTTQGLVSLRRQVLSGLARTRSVHCQQTAAPVERKCITRLA